jgi:predicted acyltransferase
MTPGWPATGRAPVQPLPDAAPLAALGTRYPALDVFRGATVALMIGVNNPGSWNHLFPPLAHAAWHGCTPTDLVFPFFLFAVGNALAFTLPGLARGPSSAFWGKLLKRTLLIFLIGVLLNAAPFVSWGPDGNLVPRTWENLRLMGVLQRIALAWCGAALVLRFAGMASALPAAALLLLAYWAMCVFFGAPGDPYSLEGFFGTGVDRAVLGPRHLYRGEGVPFDPEGLGSTLPAVAQVLLGAWVGDRLRRSPPSFVQVADLFVAACALALLAYVWQLAMPINKKIWTSSYVVLTSGLAIATLAVLVWRLHLGAGRGPARPPPAEDGPKPQAAPDVQDAQNARNAQAGPGAADAPNAPTAPPVLPALPGWARFFAVFGQNALFVYVMSGLIPRLDNLLRWQTHVDEQGRPRWVTPLGAVARALAPVAPDPRVGSLLFALLNVVAYWALAAWLDRRRIYIKV